MEPANEGESLQVGTLQAEIHPDRTALPKTGALPERPRRASFLMNRRVGYSVFQTHTGLERRS